MDLEDTYESIGLDRIHRHVPERTEESLYLDFKTTNSPDFSHADDRKNLSTALSGFANSSGGLIVWGVDCRKLDKDSLDVVAELKPISDVVTFVSRINEWGRSRTSGQVQLAHSIAAFLVNVGRGSARNLFARISVNGPFQFSPSGSDKDGRGGLPRFVEPSPQQWLLRGDSSMLLIQRCDKDW